MDVEGFMIKKIISSSKSFIFRFVDVITNDEKIEFKYIKLISLLSLMISCGVAFYPFEDSGIFGTGVFMSTHNFTPGIISSIVALFFMAPLYIRGKLPWNLSIYNIVSFVLIYLLFASFVELVLGNGSEQIDVTYILIGTSLLLSWLGMSAVAGFSWVFVFIAVIFNLIQRDVEMGILGFVYICSGFLGLILHSGLNPGHLFEELKTEFSKAITDTQKEELLAAGDATKKAASAATDLAAQAVKIATKI